MNNVEMTRHGCDETELILLFKQDLKANTDCPIINSLTKFNDFCISNIVYEL